MPKSYRLEYVFVNPEDLPPLEKMPSMKTMLVAVEQVLQEISADSTTVTVELRYHGPAGA